MHAAFTHQEQNDDHIQNNGKQQQSVNFVPEFDEQQQPHVTAKQRQRRLRPEPPDGLHISQLPQHIAIIMDGNFRYAQAHGWQLSAGHEAGVAALRRTVESCARFGVRGLTVYAFSEENWQRDGAEVAFLMALFERALRDELERLEDNNVRLRFIGSLERLPLGLQQSIVRAEAQTARNDGLLLTVAVSYSAQADIAGAARRLAEAVAEGRMRPEEVTAAAVASQLSTAPTLSEVGPPDLLIRTSNMQRLSNFLLFELAYAELWFEDVLWPAFGEEHLVRALRQYAARERRFGGRQVGKPALAANR